MLGGGGRKRKKIRKGKKKGEEKRSRFSFRNVAPLGCDLQGGEKFAGKKKGMGTKTTICLHPPGCHTLVVGLTVTLKKDTGEEKKTLS